MNPMNPEDIPRTPKIRYLYWFIWLIIFAILLEYMFTSLLEDEIQASVLAGALFLFLLTALGIITFMRKVESQNLYRDLADDEIVSPQVDWQENQDERTGR
jgi:hypothetical protein